MKQLVCATNKINVTDILNFFHAYVQEIPPKPPKKRQRDGKSSSLTKEGGGLGVWGSGGRGLALSMSRTMDHHTFLSKTSDKKKYSHFLTINRIIYLIIDRVHTIS